MTQFENKVCIVTGGASGIGAKTAEMFVQRGGQVVIGDVNDEAGEGLAAAIGDKAVFFHLDVSDPASCEAAVDLAVARFGSVDGVVNSAIKMAPGPLKDLAHADWNLVLEIGLTGSFLMSQAAGRWNDRQWSQGFDRHALVERRPQSLRDVRRLLHDQGGVDHAGSASRDRMGPVWHSC